VAKRVISPSAATNVAAATRANPRRAFVERTFAWMTRWRPLVRDYEERIDVPKP
jgi:hypothetical protein